MPFTLPALPYALDALTPHISQETLEYHYHKHHQGYVNKLNGLVSDTDWAQRSLIDMIKEADGAIFNNAAQIWNHSFYWQSLSPNGGGEATGKIAELIAQSFGSFAEFKKTFTQIAAGLFGSGWVWLCLNKAGELVISATSNAGNPLTAGETPLLTCDVWEHAYYIDTRNDRLRYLENFWALVNWEFANSQL